MTKILAAVSAFGLRPVRCGMRYLLGLVILVLGLPTANAALIDYTINFNLGPTSQPPLPTAGSFAFDDTTNLFSNFIVEWEGVTFDFTSRANNAVPVGDLSACLGTATGGQASFLVLSGACDAFEPGWAGMFVSGETFFAFSVNDPSTGGFWGIDLTVQHSLRGGSLATGSWSIAANNPDTEVPEPATLTLSLSALLALAYVRRRRRTAPRA